MTSFGKFGAVRGARGRRKAGPTITCWGLLATGNFGNDASFETFAHWLNVNGSDAELAIVSTDPEAARLRFGLPTRGLMTSSGPGQGPLRLAGRAFARVWDVVTALLILPRSTDSLVVPGMGILEDSIKVSPLGLPLLLAVMAVGCRHAGTRFLLVDVGAEFPRNPLTRCLFAQSLRQATHVSVRDRLSHDVVTTADPHRHVLPVPDLVFAHPAMVTTAPVPSRVVVGVICAERSLGERGAGYTERMVHLVQGLLKDGLEVVLVGGDSSDVRTAHEIANRCAALEAASLGPRVADVDDYAGLLDLVATGEVVVASRYHNLVAAIRAGRPILSIGYAPKCTQLLQSVGLASYAYELTDFDADAVHSAVMHMLATSEEIAQLVQERSREFGAQVESLLGELAPVLQSTRRRRHHGDGLWN